MKNFTQFINKELTSYDESKKYHALQINHSMMLELFDSTLTEGDDSLRQEVIDKIRAGDWESPQKPESFAKSLGLTKHKEMLTMYTVDELSHMKLFKLKGFNLGFALKEKDGKFQEIVALHNNEPSIKNIGEILMDAAIHLGGRFLDHFDSPKLTALYTKHNFQEYQRDSFNPEYDPEGKFRAKYGPLDVVYRKRS